MDISASSNYKKSNRLKSRKSLYLEFGYPKVDILQEILDTYHLKGNERILDLGCGFGDALIQLRKRGHKGKLIGVDISEGMIVEAKKASKVLDIDFRVSKAEDLPFKEKSFDIILCKHALYHFNVPQAVEEIERCLTNEGVLLLTLNSYALKSRYYVETYKELISKTLNNYNFPDTKNNVNFETYQEFFKNFLIIKETKPYRYITLKESTPFVEYMATFREYWEPLPKDNEWEKALNIIREDINKVIKEKGHFQEKACFGISVLEKNLQS